MNSTRDFVRYAASSLDAATFPRAEPALVPIGELFDLVLRGSDGVGLVLNPRATCPNCGELDLQLFHDMGFMRRTCYSGTISTIPDGTSMVSSLSDVCVVATDRWIMNLRPFDNSLYEMAQNYHRAQCNSNLTFDFAFANPPPVLIIEVPYNMVIPVWPSLTLAVNSSQVSYKLAAMVFLRDGHYWCELITGNRNIIAIYDGQRRNGSPELKGTLESVYGVRDGIVQLGDNLQPCLYVYVITTV